MISLRSSFEMDAQDKNEDDVQSNEIIESMVE